MAAPEVSAEPPHELSMTSTMLASVLQALTSQGRSIRFRVRGPSMQPFIKDNDLVTVSAVTQGELKPGDVAALIHPVTKRLVLHRIVGKTSGGGYMIKADMKAAVDGMFSQGDIAGRVTAVERNGRLPRMGLGPERRIIAWFSRMGLLVPAIRVMARFKKLMIAL